MRRLSADYIFPIASEPIKNGVITIDDDGLIIDVESSTTNPQSEIEHYKGIICPGFINTHCHIELSHLRSQVSEHLGISGFIKAIVSKRTASSKEFIQEAIEAAEREMSQNGIVAVGDISNNNSSFKQKEKKNLLYHTFVEVFDLNPDRAEESFNKGLSLQQELSQFTTHSSIIPHAPYTVSESLLSLINKHAAANKSIISIHNQESEAENELFISHSGAIYEIFKAMGIDTNQLRITGVNSLQSTLSYLTKASKLLLVHNTYATKEDIKWAKKLMQNSPVSNPSERSASSNASPIQHLYWCTCPNANLYIENKLPDYNFFIEEDVPVTIGTDSLASNWSLSILDELKTISNYYPHIPLQTLLLWATKNGADFLGFTHLGTIEKGKKPGLNLLKNIKGLRISEKTEIQKLM